MGAHPEVDIRLLADHEIDRVTAVLGLARLFQRNGIYLVAWENHEPLGHAYIAFVDPPQLQNVLVRTDHRRRGGASALTSAAEAVAHDRWFRRLKLEVSKDNVAG